MKRYFIDTNIFLRFLIKDAPSPNQACIDFFKAVKSNRLQAACSDLVLAEIAWTLNSYYKFPKQQIADSLNSIRHLRGVLWSNRFDTSLALQLYQENNVKFIDSLLSSIPQIQSGRWTIVSYDHDFDKLRLNRLEPQQISA